MESPAPHLDPVETVATVDKNDNKEPIICDLIPKYASFLSKVSQRSQSHRDENG